MLNQIKDPFSVVSHLAKALFSVVALILLVTLAALYASVWHVVSFSVYGSAMVLLYTSRGTMPCAWASTVRAPCASRITS